MKQEISLEERKQLQLQMLKEIDAFCKSHGIKYSLAFGTLLGAIRHKGFIPWDDDVDIIMPLPELLKLKKLFKSESIEYCDVDTTKYYSYAFSRLTSKRTFNKKGLFIKEPGVSIDVYPIVSVPDAPSIKNDVFWGRAQELFDRRMMYMKWGGRIFRFSPISVFPTYEKTMRLYRDYMLFHTEYGSTNTYYVIAGPLDLRGKMTYDFDVFEEMTDVEFEGDFYPSISRYDDYLTLRYGDYMKLPPEDQRHPYHGGRFYWK